jgi:hypothetical protein
MPVIDLTETEEYRARMEEAIAANRGWLEDLGYEDAEFDMKAWILWHRLRQDAGE